MVLKSDEPPTNIRPSKTLQGGPDIDRHQGSLRYFRSPNSQIRTEHRITTAARRIISQLPITIPQTTQKSPIKEKMREFSLVRSL